jgi:hypothetical protein
VTAALRHGAARPAFRREPGAPPAKPGGGWLVAVAIASGAGLAFVDADAGRLVFPLLVLLNVVVLYFVVLWRRDRELPVFEIGSLWVAAAFLYSAIPLLNVLINGLQWGAGADGRLQAYAFDLDAVSAFAWRYVAHVASFVVVYLVVRRRATAAGVRLVTVRPSTTSAFVIALALPLAVDRLMALVYGFRLEISYADLAPTTRPTDMPYVAWQVTLALLACVLAIKQGLVLSLIRRWNRVWWRRGLLVWLAAEMIGAAVHMGERGAAVRLLMTFTVLYHRFVRPIRAATLATVGLAVLIGFLAQGIVRSGAVRVEGLDLRTVLASNNEFQAIFATAYDLYQRQAADTLPPVPWQIYLSDLYMVVPSQLLPFIKWDPAEWYLDVIGARGSGVGFMFGVMAQAVLGLDWLELIARGIALGSLFAVLHRWYVRRAHRMWPTLFYLFVAAWSYYTLRATSFYFVAFVVYHFLPVMVLVSGLRMAMSAAAARRRAA